MDHVGNTGVVSSRRLAKNAPVNRSEKFSEYYEVGSPSQVRVSISPHGKLMPSTEFILNTSAKRASQGSVRPS